MNLIKPTLVLFFSLYPVQSFGHKLILTPGEKIMEDKIFTHGNCELIVQKDGNLVVKKNGKRAWSSEGKVPGSKGNKYFARMQKNGDFVVKSKGKMPVFRSYTNGQELGDNGGLYFEDNCDLIVAKKSRNDIIWSNVRSNFQSGNRLRKGEMFRFLDHNIVFTLHLQHDGNLIVFKGKDLSEFSVEKVTYTAHVFSQTDEFFLEFTCDGHLILKEKLNANSKDYEEYWVHRLVADSSLREKNSGYALTLPKGVFDYTKEDKCMDEDFTVA